MPSMFHISEDGKPRPCSAQPGKCKLGEHYETVEEGQEAYEKSRGGSLPQPMKKTVPKAEKSEFNIVTYNISHGDFRVIQVVPENAGNEKMVVKAVAELKYQFDYSQPREEWEDRIAKEIEKSDSVVPGSAVVTLDTYRDVKKKKFFEVAVSIDVQLKNIPSEVTEKILDAIDNENAVQERIENWKWNN